MSLIQYVFSIFLWFLFFWLLVRFMRDILGKRKLEKVKKKSSPKIQAVLDHRKLSIKKQKEDKKILREEERYMRKFDNWERVKGGEAWIKLRQSREAKKCVSQYLSVGSINDYFNFLDCYIENGGVPTHHYNGTCRERIYIAKSKCKIFSSEWKDKIVVIVMPGCEIIHGKNGHNNFYFYDDILNQKYAEEIPTYKNWAKRCI